MGEQHKGEVLFFDGVCNLCNGVVSLLLRLDSRRRIMYASLQGEAARQILPLSDRETLNSFVFKDGKGALFRESDAVIALVQILPWPWPIFCVLRIVPKVLRDWCYQFVARNRYRLFGQRGVCRVPTAEERAQFLD